MEKKALDEEAKKKRDYLMSSQDIEILNQEIVTLRDQLTAYKSSLIDVDKQIEADLISLKTMEKSGIRSNIDIVEIESKIQLKGTQTGGQAVLGENGENSNSNNANSYKATDSSTMEQAIEIKLTNTSNLSDAMLTAQRTQIETRLVQNVSEKEVLEKKIDELQQRLSDLRATLATEEYKYNEVMRDYELAEASCLSSKKSEAEQNAAEYWACKYYCFFCCSS